MLEFIQDYRVPLLIVSVALVAFTIWNERRQGSSEIQSLTHLEDELGLDSDSDGREPSQGE